MPVVTLHIVQNKVEVGDVFKRMEDDYAKENPGVRLHFDTFGGGEDFSTRLTAQFQSDNVPDAFTNDGFSQLDPWLYTIEDLSDQPWVADLLPGTTEPVTRNGKIYGMPEAYEGVGFAYNKTLFAKAGITDLPDTLDSLEAACIKLQAAGIQPFVNTYAEWWVLGNHNLNVPLGHQKDAAEFIAKISAGQSSFAQGVNVDGWLRLLDMTTKFGQPDATVSGGYATTVAAFAAGQAAMIQQGNWIQPSLDKANPGMDVGFLPMPVSNTPDNKLFVGVPNFFVVNSQSPNKQLAKDWLNWLATSATGQRYLTQELQYVPCFRTISSGDMTGLNRALAEKIAAGETYPWQYPRLPSGASMDMAISITRYIEGRIAAEELYSQLDQAIVKGAIRSEQMSDAATPK